jgi:hypothetical protein
MDGNVNCMHSKLMLLFYDDGKRTGAEGTGQRCRIVVPTANLIGTDWGVGGIMENTVFLIDLPLHACPPPLNPASRPGINNVKSTTTQSPPGSQGQTQTHFQSSLFSFLKAQTVPEDVLVKLNQFDFSSTSKLGFVHTIGGMHDSSTSSSAWRTTGVCGLGRTIHDLGLDTRSRHQENNPIELDYVTSSVGSLTDEFMRSMYLAAQGDDGLTEYTLRTSKQLPSISTGASGTGKRARDQQAWMDDWQEKFRFFFPSEDTVRASKGGIHNAGTICFSSKWWGNSKFPRTNMRDCISTRKGVLMHNKVCFCFLSRHTSLLLPGLQPWSVHKQVDFRRRSVHCDWTLD